MYRAVTGSIIARLRSKLTLGVHAYAVGQGSHAVRCASTVLHIFFTSEMNTLYAADT